MGFLDLHKCALFALLICAMGAQTVIEEVVGKSDEKCSVVNEICFPEEGINCCEGYHCFRFLIYPPVAGRCIGPVTAAGNNKAGGGGQVIVEEVVMKKPNMIKQSDQCAKLGETCDLPQYGGPECCPPHYCLRPRILGPFEGECI